MQACRLAATVLALTLGIFACPSARAQAAPTDGPIEVTVGAYVNDIQQPDFKANSYAIDLYVWFRWRAPDLDPYKTLEFMNRDASDDSNLQSGSGAKIGGPNEAVAHSGLVSTLMSNGLSSLLVLRKSVTRLASITVAEDHRPVVQVEAS